MIEDGLPHYTGDVGNDLASEWLTVAESPVVEEPPVTSENYQGGSDVLDGYCYCRALRFCIARPPEDYNSHPILQCWVKP